MKGLAQRIVEGDVPGLLLNKRVLQLDVGSLVAGTMYRGQFEERLKRVIDELKSPARLCLSTNCTCLWGPVPPARP